MGRLDRYILREVALSWAAVTLVLMFVLVGNQVAQVLGQAAEYRYPHGVVWHLILLTSIQNLSVVVPVGLLLGIMLALGRLYHESEMTAIRACGVGPLRLLWPPPMIRRGARRVESGGGGGQLSAAGRIGWQDKAQVSFNDGETDKETE